MVAIGEIGGLDTSIFTTANSGEFNIPTGSEFDDLMKGEFTEISTESYEPPPSDGLELEYDSSEVGNNASLMKALLQNQG